MKKLTLFIILFMGIMPFMHKGKFTLINSASVYAQSYSEEDDCDDTDPASPCYCNPDDPSGPCFVCSDTGDDYEETITGSDNCFTYVDWTEHYWDCETDETTAGSFTNGLTTLTAASVSLSSNSGNVGDAVTVTAGSTTSGNPPITYNYEEYDDDTEDWSTIASTTDESIVYILDVPGEVKFRVTAVSSCGGSVVSSKQNYFATDIPAVNCAFTFDPTMITTKDAGGPAFGDLFGLTQTGSIDFTMGVCSDGTNWHPYLLTVTGHYYSESRLPPGVTEVTGPSGNTNSSNYCDQMIDLENLGYNITGTGTGSWYMLSAVVAHEDFHVSKLSPALHECLADFKALMNSFSLPVLGHSQANALSSLTTTAYSDFTKAAMARYWNLQMALDSIGDEGPGSGTEAAEYAVVDPMVTTICNFSKAPAQNWPPCPGSSCQ